MANILGLAIVDGTSGTRKKVEDELRRVAKVINPDNSALQIKTEQGSQGYGGVYGLMNRKMSQKDTEDIREAMLSGVFKDSIVRSFLFAEPVPLNSVQHVAIAPVDADGVDIRKPTADGPVVGSAPGVLSKNKRYFRDISLTNFSSTNQTGQQNSAFSVGAGEKFGPVHMAYLENTDVFNFEAWVEFLLDAVDIEVFPKAFSIDETNTKKVGTGTYPENSAGDGDEDAGANYWTRYKQQFNTLLAEATENDPMFGLFKVPISQISIINRALSVGVQGSGDFENVTGKKGAAAKKSDIYSCRNVITSEETLIDVSNADDDEEVILTNYNGDKPFYIRSNNGRNLFLQLMQTAEEAKANGFEDVIPEDFTFVLSAKRLAKLNLEKEGFGTGRTAHTNSVFLPPPVIASNPSESPLINNFFGTMAIPQGGDGAGPMVNGEPSDLFIISHASVNPWEVSRDTAL